MINLNGLIEATGITSISRITASSSGTAILHKGQHKWSAVYITTVVQIWGLGLTDNKFQILFFLLIAFYDVAQTFLRFL